MKLNFDWWRWLVIIGFAMLIMSFFCRCTTTKYVPMVQYKEKIVNKTDSFLLTDSVWLHDSIFVSQKGDTVLTDRWHYRDRYKYIYKNSTDALVVHDSIPYKVEITKPPNATQTFFLRFGYVTPALLSVLSISVFIFLAIKIRKA